MTLTVFPQTLLAIWVSCICLKELPNALAPSKLPGWAGVTAGKVSLFTVISLAAQVGTGLAPSKFPLFSVIPLQVASNLW